MKLFRALHVRPFALLWSGQTVSRLGDGLFSVALSWWVLEQTGSAVAMGMVQLFRLVPNLIFLLIGGVLADRLPRLRVMLVSDVLRGLLLVIVTVLTALHTLQVWNIYLASLVFGFVDAFFQPSYSAVVPDVVPAEDLPSANSLTALSGQFAGILGTASGGIIVAIGGSSIAFGLDSLSFFISAACVLPLLGRIAIPKRQTDTLPPNAVRELREGLSTVFGIRWVWITILLSAFVNMFISSAFSIATPFLVKDTLHADSAMFGFILALFSFGSVIGAVGMGSVHKLKQRGPRTYFAWIGATLLIIPIGFSQSIVLDCVLTVFIGMGFAVGQLIWINVLQERIPASLLGRVSSVDQFGSFVLMPLGLGFVGWATGQFGAPILFSVGALIAAGVFVRSRVKVSQVISAKVSQ